MSLRKSDPEQYLACESAMNVRAALVVIPLALSACATTPLGPTVQVMPAPGKPFSAFQDDDVICRNFANSQVAGGPEQANANVVGSAVVGTLLGAALGAAIGRGPGAAIGAASGAVIGTGAGANGSAWSQMSIQQRYKHRIHAVHVFARKSGARLQGYRATAKLPAACAPAALRLERSLGISPAFAAAPHSDSSHHHLA